MTDPEREALREAAQAIVDYRGMTAGNLPTLIHNLRAALSPGPDPVNWTGPQAEGYLPSHQAGPEPVAGLDVERLTQAAHNSSCGYDSHDRSVGPGDWPCSVTGVLLAAEYAALSETEP